MNIITVVTMVAEIGGLHRLSLAVRQQLHMD
jgi:hypothetical protein